MGAGLGRGSRGAGVEGSRVNLDLMAGLFVAVGLGGGLVLMFWISDLIEEE